MSIPTGERFGPYRIAESIGSGGMGDVYRATDVNLKRDVAIKVLPASFVTDENRLARFQREAEVLASLNHSNIAHLYGLEKNGATTALVMELVAGPTLAERIAQGPLPPSEALGIALQIAAALEAAHEQGIVHRDLKPANIKVKSDGVVKVLDFGIAKALDPRAGEAAAKALTTPAMTEAGLVLGTAAYMAPEQARGRAVDERADVWAFGCVLYELLVGKPAFLGDDVSTTLARVLEREPDLSALPKAVAPNVRTTIELCLKKDVRKRIADIRDVRLALEGTFESRATNAPVGRGETFWRRALPLAAVLGTVIVASAYLWRPITPPPPPPVSLPVTRFVITPPAEAPLTSLGGYDIAISPDGERLAYLGANVRNGSMALYIRELDGLEPRLVAGAEITSTVGTANPFFSRDSRSVGLFAPGRGVVRLSLDGAPPQQIIDHSGIFVGAEWAADGSLIYSSGSLLYRVSPGGTPQLLVGTPSDTPLTAATTRAGPVLLPGERALLYAIIQGETERVAVLDLETGEERIIAEGGQNPHYTDTGHLVFARGTTLMAAPFDLAELAVTKEPIAVLQGVRHPNASTAADYTLSANGTLAYVQDGGESSEGRAVVWVDRTGRAGERVVAELIPNARSPRLSPDGSRLLLSTAPLNDGDLWVYGLGGRPPLPLAIVGTNISGVWSPDSTQIAFARITGTALVIAVTRADGSQRDAQQLSLDRVLGTPTDWSRAGELLFAVVPTEDILATAVSGDGDVRDVVVTSDREFDGALSPNGRWLAYVSSRTGQLDVWVKGYPDGVPERVSQNGGYEPRWSADGRELFYLQANSMMAVSVETEGEFSFGMPAMLFNGSYFVQTAPIISSYDVARDGRFVMIQPQPNASPGRQSSIVVVQNWTEELRRLVPTGR